MSEISKSHQWVLARNKPPARRQSASAEARSANGFCRDANARHDGCLTP